MTTTTPTDVVLAALRAVGGFAVGDSIARTDQTELVPPYVYLMKITTTYNGPLNAINADASLHLQCTSVGYSRGSSEALAGTCAAVITGPLPNPSGLVLAGAVHREYSNGPHRDDNTNPPRYYAVDQYYLPFTPA